MPSQEPEPRNPGIGISGIIRMLFKHKWKVVFSTMLGVGIAAAIYLNHTPVYESVSKIFIRYVEEVSNVDPTGNAVRRTPTIESVINAEVEILRSWDLAKTVVQEVTPEAILRGREPMTPSRAAQVFGAGLDVQSARGARVISVTYRHPDPDVAVRALTTLVKQYQDKHVEIHRATKSRETSRSRRAAMTAKISELTELIEQTKAKHGISSLPEAAMGLNRRSDEIRAEASRGEVDYEEQKARVAELKRLGRLTEATATESSQASSPSTPAPAVAIPDHEAHLRYQSLTRQLTALHDEEIRLLTSYSRDSAQVKEHRRQIADLETQRGKLEIEHPGLLAVAPRVAPGVPVAPTVDPLLETIRLATLKARVDLLQKRQLALKEEFKEFASVSKQIHELERERNLQEEGLREFAGSFQRTEFETPLTSDHYDNIVIVQSSSPPVLALSALKKMVGGVAFGGFALGLGLIALLEFGFNRTVKRPLELETRAGIPLMLSIPHVSKSRRLSRAGRKELKNKEGSTIEVWSGGHFIRAHVEALRDRLVLYFEQIGLTRKPKLVAVTSQSRGAGVSTIAGGIAAAMSEVGDGKVLLVDMNTGHAEVHPFFEGRPAATLTEALESNSNMESAAENLYLATANSANGNGAAKLFPKRFYDLMPNFQASEFDYIIFDMPPLEESSLTLAMAGFMDQTILVVEAEKDNPDAVRRAGAELIRAKAKLSGVLNKTRSYGPKWLQEA